MRGLAGAALATAVAATACAPVYTTEPGPVPGGAATAERGEAPGVPPEGPARERWYPPPPPDDEIAERSLSSVLSGLVWPLAAERATILTSGYGHRPHPSDGVVRFHRGLDLRARGGDPVYAAADGVVLRSEAAGAYGWMVEIDHGAGLRSLYAHHRRNLVREGEPVRRGEVIALVGRSGNATGEHLHFELRWKDGTVDPWTVLPPLTASRSGR